MDAHGMKKRMSEFADPELEANRAETDLRQRVSAQSIADVTRTELSKKEIAQMSEKNGQAVPLAATSSVFTEAPVSWNTKYMSPAGFECQLTLRGDSAGEVLRIANNMMEKMLAAGCHPIVGYASAHNGSGSGNNHAAAPTPPAVTPPPRAVTPPAQAAEEIMASLRAAAGIKPAAPVATPATPAAVAVFCPLHPASEMKAHSKNGQVWYSHKLADGTWCRGS